MALLAPSEFNCWPKGQEVYNFVNGLHGHITMQSYFFLTCVKKRRIFLHVWPANATTCVGRHEIHNLDFFYNKKCFT